VTALLDKLPTILVLAVLVGIFLSLRRHSPSARVRLWTYAWALIFLHFFIQLFETRTGAIESIFEAIDLAALELSGMVFVISLTRAGEDRLRRVVLFAVLAVPTVFHGFAVTFDWHVRWALAGSLAVMAFGAAAYAVLETKTPDVYDYTVAVVLCIAGVWAMKSQLAGNADFAVNAILTLSFGICGVLYWIRHPRRSPGVFVVSGGFLCWGAVFPVAAALDHFMPKLQVNPELWNVPKFFVAFGMVLALLEDKSRMVERAHDRERAENRLLQRLSQISSRLLAGKDPAALCQEIAVAVTDASSFSRAALFLVAEGGALQLAGASGLSVEELNDVERRGNGWKVDRLKQLRSSDNQIGNNSFRVSQRQNEILIPLVSWRGSSLGYFWLSGSDVPDHSEIVKLEMLAADLAVTIENTRLHHRLVRSEKLAALGQLVAGVAHELNNPLTGIMGYTELLGEEIEKESTLKRVQKLGNEARRMKRIVDGLLRFARQNNPAARSADLETALKDVIQLREYHLRKLGILVEVRTEPGLPALRIGEDELKQVLLNILNNSIDAVEESAERKIRIVASYQNGRTMIQFDDSGPGFSDINRAFDPFYTTKPVGKGTGLGLSICYGIAQECGGEISLANKQPYGASVYLELPVAVTQPMVAVPA
jgi:two-component system, NtrC family, sensor kinase